MGANANTELRCARGRTGANANANPKVYVCYIRDRGRMGANANAELRCVQRQREDGS